MRACAWCFHTEGRKNRYLIAKAIKYRTRTVFIHNGILFTRCQCRPLWVVLEHSSFDYSNCFYASLMSIRGWKQTLVMHKTPNVTGFNSQTCLPHIWTLSKNVVQSAQGSEVITHPSQESHRNCQQSQEPYCSLLGIILWRLKEGNYRNVYVIIR